MKTVNNYTPIIAHRECTESFNKEYIHFTEPYYKIASKEHFQNKELNKILSHSIYSNIQNNYDYLAKTQYNTNKNNIYQVRKLDVALDKICEENRKNPNFHINTYHNLNNQKEEYLNYNGSDYYYYSTNNSDNNSNNNNNNTNSSSCKNNYSYLSKKQKQKVLLENYINKNPHLKTHNILNNNSDNIEIIHYIPSLNTQEAIELEAIQNLDTSSSTSSLSSDSININSNNNSIENLSKMYNSRYNNQNQNQNQNQSQSHSDYPPMNGLAYNKNMNNNDNYYVKNQLNQLPNPMLQQQNIHGRNDLLFPENVIPYGFYDQANLTGTNTLMCGPNQMTNRNHNHNHNQNHNNQNYNHNQNYNDYNQNNMMPMNNNMYPMNYNPNDMFCQNPNANSNYNQSPNYNMHQNMNCNQNSKPAFVQDISYGPDAHRTHNKNSNSSINGKDNKKELSRKNLSKLKKGMIDINIETSSSNKQGVCIDLNIGVGN